MSAAGIALELYLSIGLALVAAWALARGLILAVTRGWLRLKFGAAKRIVELACAVALLAPLALGGARALWPETPSLRPPTQVWDGIGEALAPLRAEFARPSALREAAGGDARRIEAPARPDRGAAIAIALLAAATAAAWWRGRRRLHAALDELPRVARRGRIDLRAHPALSFAAPSGWSPRRWTVVLPEAALADRGRLRWILRHELQHVRAGDLRWAQALYWVRGVFAWNPAAHALARALGELQELACDEAVLVRRRDPLSYGRALLWAAETALRSPRAIGLGAGFLGTRAKPHPLRRRMEMLTSHDSRTSRPWTLALAAGLSLVLVATAAAVAPSSGRAAGEGAAPLTESRARALAAEVKAGFPVEMNDLVLKRLRRWTDEPGGRKWARAALARLPSVQPMIDRKALEHGVPKDVVALAFFESGFERVLTSSMKAKGIWQFIPATARNYGLVVDERRDERLDDEKATDAAMRYLKALHVRLGDWRLAFKGYNEGERRVEKLIQTHGTRDPWKLERLSSTEGYLAGAIAAVILVKHPELVADGG